MSQEPYEPVSCDYHDQLEAAAMHKREVELEFDLDGVPQRLRGTITDVYTADGAEFVKFAGGAGLIEIRLDHIISMRDGRESGVGGRESE
ncbi:MAG TPA: Rho-binding antiterminator [Thermoanaerobaculia bacterium]|nr:Rho-binding antiterminator [Thermoanaerobaculia bacterium]